jgi:acetyl-CoA acetyltransferase
MEEAIKGFDKSLLAADQKKVYDAQEAGLKENAEHIANSTDKIEHQRKHFSSMSEGMYALVKAFGGGKTLYHDHCPMAKDGQGAMWLSETKEIKNPYFGDKMMECGSVEEEIQ